MSGKKKQRTFRFSKTVIQRFREDWRLIFPYLSKIKYFLYLRITCCLKDRNSLEPHFSV